MVTNARGRANMRVGDLEDCQCVERRSETPSYKQEHIGEGGRGYTDWLRLLKFMKKNLLHPGWRKYAQKLY